MCVPVFTCGVKMFGGLLGKTVCLLLIFVFFCAIDPSMGSVEATTRRTTSTLSLRQHLNLTGLQQNSAYRIEFHFQHIDRYNRTAVIIAYREARRKLLERLNRRKSIAISPTFPTTTASAITTVTIATDVAANTRPTSTSTARINSTPTISAISTTTTAISPATATTTSAPTTMTTVTPTTTPPTTATTTSASTTSASTTTATATLTTMPTAIATTTSAPTTMATVTSTTTLLPLRPQPRFCYSNDSFCYYYFCVHYHYCPTPTRPTNPTTTTFAASTTLATTATVLTTTPTTPVTSRNIPAPPPPEKRKRAIRNSGGIKDILTEGDLPLADNYSESNENGSLIISVLIDEEEFSDLDLSKAAKDLDISGELGIALQPSVNIYKGVPNELSSLGISKLGLNFWFPILLASSALLLVFIFIVNRCWRSRNKKITEAVDKDQSLCC